MASVLGLGPHPGLGLLRCLAAGWSTGAEWQSATVGHGYAPVVSISSRHGGDDASARTCIATTTCSRLCALVFIAALALLLCFCAEWHLLMMNCREMLVAEMWISVQFNAGSLVITVWYAWLTYLFTKLTEKSTLIWRHQVAKWQAIKILSKPIFIRKEQWCIWIWPNWNWSLAVPANIVK